MFALHFYVSGPRAAGYWTKVPNPTIEYVVQEIGHVVDLLNRHGLRGIDHVALGGDYFPEDGAKWIVGDDDLQSVAVSLAKAH